MLGKKIFVFRQTSAKFNILDGEKELVRPYINSLKIKLIKNKSFFKESQLDDNFLTHKSDFQIWEQSFRVTSKTSFKILKTEACDFWGLKNEEEYKFYDDKANEIIIDNDKNHGEYFHQSKKTMTVEKFFETFLLTKAVLLMMKPQLRQESLISFQKESIRIRQNKNIKHQIRNS